MDEVSFRTLKGALPNRRQLERKQQQVKKQQELREKMVCLYRHRFNLGPKSCCRQKCMLRLDLDAVQLDRSKYLKLAGRDQQTLWLRQHYQDESSITGFSFR